MAVQQFDTFISYRRNTGSQLASRIYDYLLSKGKKPFLDIAEMNGGRFDTQLRHRVRSAVNFVLVLSEGALDRCSQPEDWIAQEIALALSSNSNIVLAMEDNFLIPSDDVLPENIRCILNFEAVRFNQANFNERIGLLERMLHFPRQEPARLSDADYGKNYRKLTGKFMTVYEDYDNGEIVLRSAPAVIRQTRSKITGTTTFGDEREWALKARIFDKTRIAGIYTATDRYDNGIGTFFLEIKNSNRMEGYWAGYDSVNQRLTYGSYTFTRIFTEYAVSEIRQKDYPAVCSLADQQLGAGYVSIETLRRIHDSESADHCLVARHAATGAVIAFCIYKVITPEKAEELCRGKKTTFSAFGNKIGYLATIAVSEKYRGNGIASRLIGEVHERFAHENINYIISTAWKHAGKINIGNVLERSGYHFVLEVPDYWYEDSVQKGFSCPQCGNPCHCACVIFEKYL